LSETEIVAKFTDAAERVFTPAKSARLVETLLAVDKLDDISPLVRALGRE
jgi:hypothetical protein